MLITDSNQITAAWLTHVLRESGSLPSGEVAQLRITSDASYTSNIARLHVSYTASAPADAPARLWLKLARLDAEQRVVGAEQRQREVLFYQQVAARMPYAPVIRCYHAAFDDATSASLLLFEDVSDTHAAGRSTIPPDPAQCRLVMEAFAAWHAFWWDHPLLGEVADLPTPESAARDAEAIRATWAQFAEFAGDGLTPAQLRAYERVLAALPRLLQRVTQGRNLTLIHGDAHMANVMLPSAHPPPIEARALIIDWQLWGISYWADDLANLMALHWDREQRRGLERDMLLHYHAQLTHRGVRDYAWADCWDDYRLAVIVRVMFMPMWFWVTGAALGEVWRSLRSAWLAYEDLACYRLLV